MSGRPSFRWWDDAVTHAHWLASRSGIRQHVYRSWCGLWCIRDAGLPR